MRTRWIIAAAALAAGCGNANLSVELKPEGDELGDLQHGLQARLEEKFGPGARVQRVFGRGDELVLGVTQELKVEESDVRAPLALASYRRADGALGVISSVADFKEARALPGRMALVTSGGELRVRAADGAERAVASSVKGEVVPAGAGLIFTQEQADGAAGETRVVIAGADDALTAIADAEGVDDRPSISPDGKTVIFVSGRTGVASLWRTTIDGAAPEQLTNANLRAGLEREGPPEGFVPPPVMADRIEWLDANTVRYDAGDGELWTVNVRTGAARREGVSP